MNQFKTFGNYFWFAKKHFKIAFSLDTVIIIAHTHTSIHLYFYWNYGEPTLKIIKLTIKNNPWYTYNIGPTSILIFGVWLLEFGIRIFCEKCYKRRKSDEDAWPLKIESTKSNLFLTNLLLLNYNIFIPQGINYSDTMYANPRKRFFFFFC